MPWAGYLPLWYGAHLSLNFPPPKILYIQVKRGGSLIQLCDPLQKIKISFPGSFPE